MPDKKRSHKLSADEQTQVCQWLAEMYNSQEVADFVEERYHISITESNVRTSYLHSPKWKPIIAALREDFLSNLNKIPIANKSVRLKYLQKVYKEAMTWRVAAYSRDGIAIEKLKVGAAIQAISQAQDEIEGKRNNGDQLVQIFVTKEGVEAKRAKIARGREAGIIGQL